MAEWIRFEDGRTRQHAEFGTLMKDGRLVITNDIAIASGVVPGQYVEVYYKPENKVVGLKVVPVRTPYSLKVSSTGPQEWDFTQPLRTRQGRDAGKPASVVSLRSLLNSRHIGLASKVKGHLYVDQVSGMLVFEFPESPQVITPSTHAGDQMQKMAFTERVTGDVG